MPRTQPHPTTAHRTQEERRAETRQRLLDAARDLIAERGVAGASVDALAEAADRTSGALYAQFGNKEGLLVALLDRWKDATADAIVADFAAARSAEGRLRSLWANFVDPPPGGSEAWVMLEHELWLYACRNPASRAEVAGRYEHARRHLATGLETTASTATLLIALMLGLEMQRRLDPEAATDELALAGLRALLEVGA